MKIDSSNINLSSSRVYEEKNQETEELREWGKRKNSRVKQEKDPNPGQPMRAADRVTLSAEARTGIRLSMEQSTASISSQSAEQTEWEDDDQSLDSRLMTLKRMVESITGKEIKIARIDRSAPETAASSPEKTSAEQTEQAPQEQEWGMSYSHYESHYESEQTSFSAQGIVKTSDGKEISFSVDLAMSREYFSEERIEIKQGAQLIDPLVINYAGTAAELEDISFEFDLTMDGKAETIQQLAPGSGFLVFDKNKVGKINDGSELFGPSTGDGFEELAAYDEDSNNWIDENDSIYANLSLWRRENDADVLTSLKSANVGAIYLGNADTSFDLKNQSNELMAQVQKTGVYLKETGGVGTVQQIDFSA